MTEVISGLLEFDHFAGEIKDGELHIGQTAVPVYNPENKTKVPDVLFYENYQVRTGCILFHLESVGHRTAAQSKSLCPLFSLWEGY